ncbi:DUF5719 family protein [Actinomyces minihominis]|uniref:DUF5719 family protein n=1 Tax=Actinomyces minihominis TaxID=2002838 RepID=UPI000C0815B9|nr:DUF5719 family protein [Actinomyces minihominis]
MSNPAKPSRWLPFLGGAGLLGLALTGAVLLPQTTEEPATTSPETIRVEMGEVPLVCPPGIIDPTRVEVVLSENFDQGRARFSATESWALGEGIDLTGGGEVRVLDSASEAGDLTGMALSGVSAGDLLSFTATGCSIPSREQAFASGATTLGENSILMVSNPTEKAVDVTASLYGDSGSLLETPVQFTVPAATTVSVLPAAWADDTENPMIVLRSDGSRVAAWLQTSGLDGEVPLGLSRSPGTAPEETVVIPGVRSISDSVLRIGNTGAERTEVQVSLLSARGEEPLPGAEGLSVGSGATSSVDLSALPSGAYALVIRGDQPLVAAVTETAVGAEHPEVRDSHYRSRTVVGPARAITGAQMPTVTQIEEVAGELGFTGVSVAVVVANTGDEEVQVEVQGATKTIGSQESVLFPLLRSQTEAELVATAPIYAAYIVTVETPAGEIRSVAGLGTEGVLAQARLVELFPDRS